MTERSPAGPIPAAPCGRTVPQVMDPVVALPPRHVEILWLAAPRAHEADRVGGKAAALSRLAADHPVPAGFAVTGDGPDLAAAGARAYAELGEPVGAVRSSAVDEDGAETSFAGQHETLLGVSGAAAVLDAIAACRAS